MRYGLRGWHSVVVSDNAQIIVDVDARAEEAVLLARALHEWLSGDGIIEPVPRDCMLGEGDGYAPGPRCGAAVEPGMNHASQWSRAGGVGIRTGRQVFDAGGNGIELTCAGCAVTFEPGSEWIDAVARWHEGDDGAAYACPSCKMSRDLSEWRGPSPWGFGCLALEFWNWPPLSESFVSAVGARLGHQTVLVRAHL